MRLERRRCAGMAVALVVVVVGLLVGGCGSSSSSASGSGSASAAASSSAAGGSGAATSSASAGGKIDVGNGMSITPAGKKPLHIGVFNIGMQNTFDQAWWKAIQAEAQRLGVQVTNYDGAFNPTTQLDQLQNAIQQKKMDAAIVFPVDSNVVCKAASQQAPAANILVDVTFAPLCSKALTQTAASPESLWQPGTMSFVGSGTWIGSSLKFFEAAAKANPDAKNVLGLGGIATQASTIIGKKSFDEAMKGRNAVYADTDFTTPGTYKVVQSYLQAHPDTNLIVTTEGDDVTLGIINALKAAGKLGKVKVVTLGGDPFILNQIQQGNIEFAFPLSAMSNGTKALDALVKAEREGGPQPRFVDDSAWGSVHDPKAIVKSNIAAWKQASGY